MELFLQRIALFIGLPQLGLTTKVNERGRVYKTQVMAAMLLLLLVMMARMMMMTTTDEGDKSDGDADDASDNGYAQR